MDGIRELAARLRPLVASKLEGTASVEVIDCTSQIGSGALPTHAIASAGVAVRPLARRRGGAALARVAAAFRALPVPVIGRVQDGALVLDLRCLEDEAAFTAQLGALQVPAGPGS